MMDMAEALSAVAAEVRRAKVLHGPMHSAHEAYAVLLEEVDELWEDIKANRGAEAKVEAVQVAAMAIRFLMEVR